MAVPQKYPWKRFWSPRGTSPPLWEDGYLLDLEAWGSSAFADLFGSPDLAYRATSLRPLSKIVSLPCLVLLGEPGIGKSTVLDEEYSRAEDELAAGGDRFLRLRLEGFGDESRLLRESFEKPEFQDWVRGGHVFHLFFDSLDECRLRIDQIAALLGAEFQKLKPHAARLRLRIACRTAEWPGSLERCLKEVWGEANVGVFELAPLRKADVKEAARLNDCAPDDFLEAVRGRQVEPLANRPVTLALLLRLFKKSGMLPANRVLLYEQGCLELVDEQNENRLASRRTGTALPQKRLEFAGLVAAALTFCNRAAIFIGSPSQGITEEDLGLERLLEELGGVLPEGQAIALRGAREVLDTGLFSGRGPSRMGFAHQTYAEFLAAWYLRRSSIAPQEILKLLRHPGDPDGSIVPQLVGTAAWAAGMVPGVLKGILAIDPSVLLGADLTTASAEERAAIVDQLLELYAADTSAGVPIGPLMSYRHLKHPELAKQLTRVLQVGVEASPVRREAVRIAVECELHELEELLVTIALDCAQEADIRSTSAHALCALGSKETRSWLLPLALNPASDPEDELKGAVLAAVWPDVIGVADLLPSLTPPKSKGLFGSYRTFLGHVLLHRASKTDLPALLRWVASGKAQSCFDLYEHTDFCEELVRRSLAASDSPELMECLVEFVFAVEPPWVKDPVWAGDENPWAPLLGDARLRQRLLAAVAARPATTAAKLAVVQLRLRLLHEEDFAWIYEQFNEASDSGREFWAELLCRLASFERFDHCDALLTAARDYPADFNGMCWKVGFVDLDSDRARKDRKLFKEPLEIEERGEQKAVAQKPSWRTTEFLDVFEQGDLSMWWKLCVELAYDDQSPQRRVYEHLPLIAELPSWRAASGEVRSRLLAAAEKYLLRWRPEPETSVGTDKSHRPDEAGYKALCLLAQEATERLAALPVDAWDTWLPVIFAYRLTAGLGPEEPHRDIMKLACERAPAARFIECLRHTIAREKTEGGRLWILRRLQLCEGDPLVAALLDELKAADLPPEGFESLLEDLLRRGVGEAKAFALALVRDSNTKGDAAAGGRRTKAAVALLQLPERVPWEAVAASFARDEQWADEVVRRLAATFSEPELSGFSDENLGAFHSWLAKRFPVGKDPTPEPSSPEGPPCSIDERWDVGRYRDRLLQELSGRGTEGAVRSLTALVEEFPERPGLKRCLFAARTAYHHNTWRPLELAELLAITTRPGRRLVRNAAHLQDAILEALACIAEKLQGKPPAAEDLWDGEQPKAEAELSDWLKRHLDVELDRLGIITAREVQITPGEKVDLWVTANVLDPATETTRRITVLLEVKGCWHEELWSAMGKQLTQRYLEGHHDCQHGIYVVAWFRCERWSPGDSRSKKNSTWTLEAAREELERQATHLSIDGKEIRAFILDATLPPAKRPPAKRKR